MTIERLENYRTIKRQIEMFRNNVNANRIVDCTSIEVVVDHEFNELCREFDVLNRYICDITDLKVREIAKLKFIMGYTYELIAEIIDSDSTTASRKLKKYIEDSQAMQEIPLNAD